jgi:hypothetical protein
MIKFCIFIHMFIENVIKLKLWQHGTEIFKSHPPWKYALAKILSIGIFFWMLINGSRDKVHRNEYPYYVATNVQLQSYIPWSLWISQNFMKHNFHLHVHQKISWWSTKVQVSTSCHYITFNCKSYKLTCKIIPQKWYLHILCTTSYTHSFFR